MDPTRPPKSLVGPDCLWTLGARSEERREDATGSAATNQNQGQTVRGVAERTRVEENAECAADWQYELRQCGHVAQRALNFQLTRTVFYYEERPKVVQWTLALLVWSSFAKGP